MLRPTLEGLGKLDIYLTKSESKAVAIFGTLIDHRTAPDLDKTDEQDAFTTFFYLLQYYIGLELYCIKRLA